MNFKLVADRFEVHIPGGKIGLPEIDQIKSEIRKWTGQEMPDDWNWDWRVRGRGKYVGNLPKRIGKYLHLTHQYDLSLRQTEHIGNIAAAGCFKEPTVFYADFTQDFCWDAGAFGDGGSCFWGGRAAARDLMKKHGSWAVRFFTDSTYWRGTARAWIYPVEDQCLLLVWNGYGMTTQQIAMILSVHFGNAYYGRIQLSNNNCTDGQLYLNDAGRAWALGPVAAFQGSSAPHYDFGWQEITPPVQCHSCRDTIESRDAIRRRGHYWCQSCAARRTYTCTCCGTQFFVAAPANFTNVLGYCGFCYAVYTAVCDSCGDRFALDSDWPNDEPVSSISTCARCREDAAVPAARDVTAAIHIDWVVDD